MAMDQEELARDLTVALIGRIQFPDPTRAPEGAVWLYREVLRTLTSPTDAEMKRQSPRIFAQGG